MYSAQVRMKARAFDSMYERPLGVAIACGCSVTIAWTCAIISGLQPLFYLAVVFSLIAALRTGICAIYGRLLATFRRKSVRRVIGTIAMIYAVLVGLLGALVLILPVDDGLRMLAVSYVLVFATAIAIRGASEPRVSLAQSGIGMVPLFFSCLWVATPVHLVFALILPGLAFGIRSLTLAMHATLAEQFTIAEECRAVSAELQYQATHDELTGLLNREGLEAELVRWTKQLGGARKGALLWLDLHKLREVNETLGYAAGDSLLCEMARRLKKATKREWVLGRFASDEFILAAEITTREEAERMVALISAELTRPVRIDGDMLESGTSIGVAIFNEDANSLQALKKAADMALLHAKANGRYQVCFYEHELTRKRAQRKEMERELRQAMNREELSVYFQPVVDLETGRIRCFEALVRWFHPEKGEIRPDEFISVAEETGQIISLGNWVTAKAAKAAAHWPEHVSLAVNLSPVQIRAPGSALGIMNALRKSGLDPTRFELEVTEGLFLEDDESTRLFMSQLSEAGIRFALDDFGTGYSSLNYIQKYPFSKIKVDRSFVSGPNIGPKTDAIIRAVAALGSNLEMAIVAEGIETVDQARAVARAGCTLGQGYYFSQAVPDYMAAHLLAEEADEFASEKKAG